MCEAVSEEEQSEQGKERVNWVPELGTLSALVTANGMQAGDGRSSILLGPRTCGPLLSQTTWKLSQQ